MREEKEVFKAKCKDAEQERDQLRKELEKLQAVSVIQKELEELREKRGLLPRRRS